MKTAMKYLLALALAGSATALFAQGDMPPQDGARGPGDSGGQGMRGHRPPPPPPVIAVLDANHDGVIDADEIANASVALKKLDKNGDGSLTRDELRPPRPDGEGPDGPPDGPPRDPAQQ